MKKSPLAPNNFPKMPAINGVKLAVKKAYLKYKNRTDLLLVEFCDNTAVAGCFTKSKTASANILWGREALKHKNAKILIVNSGNANAFNGKAGEDSVQRIVAETANIWHCEREAVFPCATGVIGEPLADEKITSSLKAMKNELKDGTLQDNTAQDDVVQDNIWQEAAKAIMTTDTFPKGVTKTAKIGETEVAINGIVKGSGMIAPDMATMLGYIFTDAKINPDKLQSIISEAVENSFNAITVDSDTSTSDTVLAFATGKAENGKNDDLSDFIAKINQVTLELAHLVVKDGEGATKFIEIEVKGAVSDNSAKKIGLAIANSPLVKTAIAGEDANWGRIVMAIGKSGEEANRDKISIAIGGVSIAKNGQLDPFYIEDKVTKHMKGKNININVDVGVGEGSFKVWTCDLTHGYISINADYRS